MMSKQKRRCIILSALLLGILTLSLQPLAVLADGRCQADEVQIAIGLGDGVKNEGTQANPIWCIPKNSTNNNLSANPIYVWVVAIMKFAVPGVGIAVTGGIVYGALIYTTASGNPAQTKKAIAIIIDALVGLIAFIMLFAIVNFIVPGGIFR